jgi:hypothetical protein
MSCLGDFSNRFVISLIIILLYQNIKDHFDVVNCFLGVLNIFEFEIQKVENFNCGVDFLYDLLNLFL